MAPPQARAVSASAPRGVTGAGLGSGVGDGEDLGEEDVEGDLVVAALRDDEVGPALRGLDEL